MKQSVAVLACLLLSAAIISAQSFKVKAKGEQTFNFEDKVGRNQVVFSSSTPLEDFTGTANAISGKVSFDVTNFAKTLKGKLSVKVESINTGIELRNHHMKSANWLDAADYPEITFEIKSVSDVKQIADNKLEFKVKGNFKLHGVTKEVVADAQAIYLDENDQTQKRAPGDLLGVQATFQVQLSDYNIDNAIIGSKVSENIPVHINIVGSNKL
ncbi:MAG: YceI family protein [Bacteroidetes bacterium]|nr:YceI family protein [Bacteroidota bacterium]